jgi:NAD(P)-dependent dehydrogenase (short-subunit alcohol dehydrogenase family)
MRWSFQDLLIAGGLGVGAYCAAREIVRRSRWIDLAGKTAIVAGGSRGLGLIIARQLVDAGANVAICARTEDDVEAAVRELRERGGSAIGVACDIRNPDEVQSLVNHVVAKWGTVDLLFNVAGIMQVGPLDEMTLTDFHEAMDSNCWGALHTILAVLPIMRRRRFGRIVNIASIGGKQAVPHMVPYDASKFALVGLSNGLRTELAKDGILVTTACPTLMRTGSPRNAEFKGRHKQEYAWFSIGGSLPLVSVDAGRAAQQVIRACQCGDGELYITNLLNPPVLAAELAPALTSEVLALINRFLPAPGGIGRRAAWGYESQSSASPSLPTSLNEQAASEHNQLRPRPESAR